MWPEKKTSNRYSRSCRFSAHILLTSTQNVPFSVHTVYELTCPLDFKKGMRIAEIPTFRLVTAYPSYCLSTQHSIRTKRCRIKSSVWTKWRRTTHGTKKQPSIG